MIKESITTIVSVDLTTSDWVNPFRGQLGLFFVVSSGNVTIEMQDGLQQTRNLNSGDFWRITPNKVIRASTTATLHYCV